MSLSVDMKAWIIENGTNANFNFDLTIRPGQEGTYRVALFGYFRIERNYNYTVNHSFSLVNTAISQTVLTATGTSFRSGDSGHGRPQNGAAYGFLDLALPSTTFPLRITPPSHSDGGAGIITVSTRMVLARIA